MSLVFIKKNHKTTSPTRLNQATFTEREIFYEEWLLRMQTKHTSNWFDFIKQEGKKWQQFNADSYMLIECFKAIDMRSRIYMCFKADKKTGNKCYLPKCSIIFAVTIFDISLAIRNGSSSYLLTYRIETVAVIGDANDIIILWLQCRKMLFRIT